MSTCFRSSFSKTRSSLTISESTPLETVLLIEVLADSAAVLLVTHGEAVVIREAFEDRKDVAQSKTAPY